METPLLLLAPQSDKAACRLALQPPSTAPPSQAHRTPPPHPTFPREGLSHGTTVFRQFGEVEKQVRRNPQFGLIKNPSTVLMWKICSVICDVIVQSGLRLVIA